MDEEIERRFGRQERRFEDKLHDCKKEVDVELDSIAQSIKRMEADIQAMKDILEAWNNMKGFASGMRFVSTVFKVIMPIVMFIVGVYWLLKTGHWPTSE